MPGTAPWPWRSSGTKPAPSARRLADAERARPASPSMRDRLRRRRQAVAGKRGEQLGLAVAGDAGDAEHLAAPHRSETCFSETPCSDRRRRVESSTIAARTVPAASSAGRAYFEHLRADHQRGQRSRRVSCARIAGSPRPCRGAG